MSQTLEQIQLENGYTAAVKAHAEGKIVTVTACGYGFYDHQRYGPEDELPPADDFLAGAEAWWDIWGDE